MRFWLLKMLGAERLIQQAFEEGWSMHSQTDHFLLLEKTPQQRFDFEDQIYNTRVWRSVEEAYANSDCQELFDDSRT